jgi:hypothetical protein
MAGTVITDTINTASGIQSTNNALLGCAKAWVNASVSGGVATINASYNVSSVTRSSTGILVVNWITAFSSASYVVNATIQTVAGSAAIGAQQTATNLTASSASFNSFTTAGTLADPAFLYVAAFGNG